MAQNEASRIRRAVESVRNIADELVVIDGGSTDDTVAICREYTDKVIVHPFEGYALQRAFALTQVTGDWILAIDADETLSPELQAAIPGLLTVGDVDAYDFSRRNYVRPGIWLQYGGFYPDYQRRLFRNGTARYGTVVHSGEVPVISGRVRQIKLDILHDQIENNVQFHFSKLMRFVRAEVRETVPSRSTLSYLFRTVRDPLFVVYKQYFVRQGFRMGTIGVRSAIAHAMLRSFVNIGLARKSLHTDVPPTEKAPGS